MNKREAIQKTTEMLEGYLGLHRKIEALRYEMRHPSSVTPEEVISQMSMPGLSDTVGGASGRISDKTMYIALNYEQRTVHLNEEENSRVAKALYPLEQKAERLEFYVGLLPHRMAQALRLHYFKGLTWTDAAKAEGVSMKAMVKRRSGAIELLAELLFFSHT